MIKYFKILIISILLINSAKAETIYDALASSYLNNNELNSQREKTIAVDEDLIQALSIFKPSITGTINQSDYLNEDQTNSRHKFPTKNKFYRNRAEAFSRNSRRHESKKRC